MESKEAIARLKGNILSDPFDRSTEVNLNDLRIVGSQMQNEYLEEIETIEKDLEDYERLKELMGTPIQIEPIGYSIEKDTVGKNR